MASASEIPGTSDQPATPTRTSESLTGLHNSDVTDWCICCICQMKSPREKLLTPNKGLQIYSPLSDRLTKLEACKALPGSMKSLKRLDDGEGVAQTMDEHNAKWHKSCYSKCNDQKVERAQKRAHENQCDSNIKEPTTSKRLRKSFQFEAALPCCFFCNKSEGTIRKVQTKEIDMKVRRIATEMGDSDIIAKLAEGDMCARDAVYHPTCLCGFYNKYNRQYNTSDTTSSDAEISMKAIAFAELIDHIESFKHANNPKVFNMNCLCKLYSDRLLELGVCDVKVNSTHLKDKIINAIPSLEDYKSGRTVVLSYPKVTGKTLLNASQSDAADDMLTLMRAANIVRKGIFDASYEFQGSLIDTRYNNLPLSLVTLVDMILTGRDISHETQGAHNVSEAVSSISQLMVFNAVKRQRNDSGSVITRHNIDRETMLPLYLGLLIHGKTRKQELVDILFDKGLSVSYRRVLDVSTDVANAVLEEYETTGIVCPPNLKNGLFSTGNLDNLDHNPQSVTTNDAFHGTAISITQHVFENSVQSATPCLNVKSSQGRVVTRSLPEKYTDIPPAALKTSTPQPTVIYGCEPPPNQDCRSDPVTLQCQWLQHVTDNINNHTIGKHDYLSWAAYFAQQQSLAARPPAITALFPLFRDSAHTIAMVKHGMSIIKDATALKNPGQIPVLTVDQPLYALSKKIQWLWPDEYGDGKYVVLMGGLHIEMALLKTIGDWLEGSGWITALCTANIVTSGRAEHVQKGSNIVRGQWTHQVMVCALYILLQHAYASYIKGTNEEPPLMYDEWVKQSSEDYPQFDYWSKTMQLELLLLKFLQSQREARYDMYKESLSEMLPWLFALDHVHYSRWLSIHLFDLERLNIVSPSTHKEFERGAFVTQKSTHRFSSIAHDQVHEQLNAVIKGDGGFIGLTESPETLKRWEVSSPELSRILTETGRKLRDDDGKHHDETASCQKRFATQVIALVDAMEELGNPFLDRSNELLTLDTKVILSADNVQSMKYAEQMGKEQYNKFMSQRLCEEGKSFYDSLKKNNLPLFRNKGVRPSSKNKDKLKAMKTDVNLFSRMYIACQHRDGDLDNFFAHENHSWPPAMAENNGLRLGSKSDLMEPLEKMCENVGDIPSADCLVIDGAAACQSIDPHRATEVIHTFEDYATKAFLPYVNKQLHSVSRVDVVFDIYKNDSLKSFTRQSRGTGEPVKVSANTRIPPNWKTFLRNDKNKTGLYEYLSKTVEIHEFMPGKTVLSTHGVHVLKSVGVCDIDVDELQPCNHEEADYRMLLHAAHAFNSGSQSTIILASDTDVVVLAIAVASLFPACYLWVAFGHAKNFRYIPVHMISKHLGPDAAWGLFLLHAITGCDTVSAFGGVGKKTAFNIWKTMPETHAMFKRLSSAPERVTDEDISTIERFVIVMYARTSVDMNVNDARKRMFAHGNRQIDKIPPTHNALVQHVFRAVYQSGHIWGQMLMKHPTLPSPSEWGWTYESGQWCPHWSTLPEASKACQELIKCGCKTTCCGRCKCKKANLPCTQLCLCNGQCERINSD